MEIAGQDLMDRLESALPRIPPSETARRILEVMRRVCRAGTATVFRERAGMLRWIAGERAPEAAIRAIRTALRHGRGPVHTLAYSETPAEPEAGRSLVVWAGRPRDAERDVVYMQGPALRPGAECAEHLARLIVLLGQLG